MLRWKETYKGDVDVSRKEEVGESDDRVEGKDLGCESVLVLGFGGVVFPFSQSLGNLSVEGKDLRDNHGEGDGRDEALITGEMKAGSEIDTREM
jgi:hypothetical protein